MPTIKTTIAKPDYDKLVAMRKREGLPSVSALFLKKTIGLTDDMAASEIVRRALAAAQAKARGTTFRLRDLFPATTWERFPKGARLRAGRAFNARVSTATDGIRIGKKSASNHQMYSRG